MLWTDDSEGGWWYVGGCQMIVRNWNNKNRGQAVKGGDEDQLSVTLLLLVAI